MPVHYAGGVGNLEEIYKIAKNKNLRIIEDAAHAFGSRYKGKLIGSFGDIACFSFDGIKNITSGEGGCIVSKDKKILTKIKNTRLLGVQKDTEKRFTNTRSFKFDVKYQGWRCHMSNIMAAIGIVQLSRFNFLSKRRQLLAKRYDSYFRNDKNIYFIEHDYEKVVPHIYVIRIYNLKNREILIKKLKKIGIETGIHYQPNHKLRLYSRNKYYLPNTEKISKEILTLPLHPSLTLKNIDYIAQSLKKLINF
jgi:dTDP-4-amino-4,6-dideoxygalactose transaminase